MFVEQALHDERMMAKDAGRNRRPRGSPAPELLFVGTPRGSFGLEFVPQTPDDPTLLSDFRQAGETVLYVLAFAAACFASPFVKGRG